MRLIITLLALVLVACAVAERPAGGGDIDGIRELDEFDTDLTELETDRFEPGDGELVNPDDLWKLPGDEAWAAAYRVHRDDAQAGAPCRYGEFKCMPGGRPEDSNVLLCNPHTLQFFQGYCGSGRILDACSGDASTEGARCRPDAGCVVDRDQGSAALAGSYPDPMWIVCTEFNMWDVRCDAAHTACRLPLEHIGRPCSPVGQSVCSPSFRGGGRDDPPGTSKAWSDIRAMGGRGLEVRCDPSGVWVFGAVCGESPAVPAAPGAEPWPCVQTGPMQYTCKVSTNLPNPIDLANERAAEAEAADAADADPEPGADR